MRFSLLLLLAFVLINCCFPSAFADSTEISGNIEKVVTSRAPQTWQEIVGTILGLLTTIWATIFGKRKLDKWQGK